MKAYQKLIKQAIADKLNVTVSSEEGEELVHCIDYDKIVDVIEDLEIATIVLYDTAGDRVSWAQIIPHDVNDDETISDYSIAFVGSTPQYIEAWVDKNIN